MKKLLLIVFCFLMLPYASYADLTIYYLDAGQANSAVILCDGDSMVIDGGLPSFSRYLYSFIKNTLSLTHIDYLVATHPDDDHIGGISAVLNAAPVDLVLSSVSQWDSKAFNSLISYANEQKAPVVVPYPGDTMELGGATITILHCWPGAPSTNDMSICLRIDYKNTSFLFTGDAEIYSEYMMLDNEELELKADVLQIGHHGSRTSSSEEFLEAVQAQYAVISCGKNNKYHHPHQETLDKLKANSIDVYRTDMMGTIICVSDGTNVEFTTEYQTQDDLYVAPKY